MSKSLAGIRVLELGRIVSAPYAGQTLGDLGAEVIKVERPGRGDDLRSYGPSFARTPAGELTGESGHYLCSNRNKRSITVDLSRAEGRQIVTELATVSDVLLENYKTGDLARYGLDYQTLGTLNPNLIYCSITGFGQSGPYARRPGLDAVFQGMSGLMAVTGDPDGEPQRVGTFVIDQMTGLYTAVAILAALRHRDAGGGGQYLDMALLDVGIATMAARTIEWLLDGRNPERLGTKSPGSAPAQVFTCADGYLNIQAGAEPDYRKLCDELCLPHLKEDPRFATRRDRVAHQELLIPLLQAKIANRTARELSEALMSRGVIASPIYRASEMVADAQVVHRKLHFSVPHPTVGEVPMVASPMRLSKTPVDIYRAPPTLGQHTDEILSDLLGYAPEKIAALREVGTI